MANDIRIRQLDLGGFIRPPAETGGPHPRVEPVLGYLVRHDRGLLLFDTASAPAAPRPMPTTAPTAAPSRPRWRRPVPPSPTSRSW